MEGNMALENKLGINDSAELARVEEKISKAKAIKLYENNILKLGNSRGLSKFINSCLKKYMILLEK